MRHNVLVHRVDGDVHPRPRVVLVLLPQRRGQPVHLRLPLRYRDARLQPSHDREESGGSVGEGDHVLGRGAPDIDVRRHAGVGRQVDAEIPRHHPHDDALLSIHLEAQSQHVAIAAEAPLPQPMTEN